MAKKPKVKEIRFDIGSERHKALAELAKAEGSSIAVIVRRAINEHLERMANRGDGL